MVKEVESMHRRMAVCALLCSGLLSAVALSVSTLRAESEDSPAEDSRETVFSRGIAPFKGGSSPKDQTPPIRLNHIRTPWPDVLHRLAEESDSTLIMHEAPSGYFTRRDRAGHSRTEAVRILNHELQSSGFRLLEQGEHLVLLRIEALRQQYQPAVTHAPQPTPEADVPQRTPPKYERRFDTVVGRTGRQSHAPAHLQQLSHAEDAPPSSNRGVNATPEIAVVRTNRLALALAESIYKNLKPRSLPIKTGPRGLSGFRVLAPTVPNEPAAAGAAQPLQPVAQFAMGVDPERNEIVIEAPRAVAAHVVQLVEALDAELPAPEIARLVSTQDEPGRTPRGLKEAVAQLSKPRPEFWQPPETPPAEPPENAGDNAKPEVDPDATLRIDGIKGSVTIREVPGIGLVVTGNKEDVDAVVRIIRELDRVGQGSTPDIHLLILQHVNSVALAELLNSVYEQLGTLRQGAAASRKTVAVVPVVKPNAVLILAPGVEMQSVLKLASELDKPVDPQSELRVFPLKSASAQQVFDTLTAFYEERGGLGTRVTVSVDIRTNSVIVHARPRDLAEVRRLIEQIDRDESGAVSRMRVFVLRNAVAQELADVINGAIQSILNPPAQTGQLGAIAVGDQASQQLRAVKSVVLEFLTNGAGAPQTVRSGILADIRVTADPRTNSLLVSAPEQSLEMLAALIEQLDQPTSTVAELKVFTLANADAASTAALLQTLFAPNQDSEQLGIQVAGADDASSSLIPLRFSVDIRTNSVIAIGGGEALRVVEAMLLRLDESDIRQRQNTVIKLKNSPVAEVAIAINEFLQSQRALVQIDPELVSNTELLEREIIVVPEPVSNSLLISATPRYFEEVQRIVSRLDEAPPQVIIQALLVEVELNNTDEFGVELGFQDSLLFDRSVVSNLVTLSETVTSPNGVQTTTQRVVSQESTPGFLFNNQQLGNNTAVNPASVGSQGLTNFSVGRMNGELGFGGLVLSASSEAVSVLIRALASRRNVQILSRPQIRTLDNQIAQIQVGQQVPIVDGVNVTATGVVNPLIRQDSAGIILTVTPRISPDGTIVMETVAEKSQFSGQGVPIFTDATTGNVVESPIKDITTARTTVSVPNGQTIVLGGMITTTDDTLERKVPWLADIPILGNVFRYDATMSRRTELLIFLTPRIIRNDADSEVVKQVEAERLHFFQEEAEALHGPLFSVPGVPGGEFMEEVMPLTPPMVPESLDFGPQGSSRPENHPPEVIQGSGPTASAEQPQKVKRDARNWIRSRRGVAK